MVRRGVDIVDRVLPQTKMTFQSSGRVFRLSKSTSRESFVVKFLDTRLAAHEPIECLYRDVSVSR
jgi:hypothetical protein